MPYGLMGFIAALLLTVNALDNGSTVKPRNETLNERPRHFMYGNKFSPKFDK